MAIGDRDLINIRGDQYSRATTDSTGTRNLVAGSGASAFGVVSNNPLSTDYWLYSVHTSWYAVTGGATAQILVYALSADGSTWTLVAQTAELTVPAAASYTLPANVRKPKATRMAAVIRAVSGTIGLGGGPRYRGDSSEAYVAGGINGAVGSPDGSWTPATYNTFASGEVTPALQLRGYANDTPTASITAPTASGTAASSPTVTVAAANDDDIADFNDRVAYVWVEIVGETSNNYDLNKPEYGPTPTTTATAGSTSSATVTPAVVLAVGWHWLRVAVGDVFGAVSAFTSWRRFQVISGVTTPSRGGPVGTVVQTLTPDFPLRYNNTQPQNAATAAVQLTQAGNVIRTSANIAVNWAPNTDQTITWAQLVTAGLAGGGAWNALSWGIGDYGYRFLVTDAAAASSPAAAAPYAFKTDTAPTIPTMVSPAPGATSTTYPTFRASVGDPDVGDETLTVMLRHYRSGDPTARFYAMTKQSNGDYTYTLQPADINVPASGASTTETFDVYAYDGTLYSNGTTALTAAAYSPSQTFVYVSGASAQITAPTSGGSVTSATVPVTFTHTGSRTNRVLNFYLPGAATPFATSTLASPGGATGPTTVPVNLSAYLRNGQTYEVSVAVTVNGFVSVSDRVPFVVNYPVVPAPGNFLATPQRQEWAPRATSVRASWAKTTYAVGTFINYLVWARNEGTLIGDASERLLAVITDPNRLYVDDTPPSGRTQRYRIQQTVRVNLDDITSAIGEGVATINIRGVILTDVNDPSRGVYLINDGGDAIGWEYNDDEDVATVMGQRDPQTWTMPGETLNGSESFVLLDEEHIHPQAALAIRDSLVAMRRRTMIRRDRFGDRRIVRIPGNGLKVKRRPAVGWDVSIGYRVEDWTELPVGTS